MSDTPKADISPPENQGLLDRIGRWHTLATAMRQQYDHRWAKNLKLIKGIWGEDEVTKSRVRNRSKIFYRKIWATQWRLLASLYNAFLRDQDSFRIAGRGAEDVLPAEIVHHMVEYRRDLMMHRNSLFLKLIWSFMNILSYGWCVGKLRWVFTDKQDEPDYVVYPNEQVFADLTADTPQNMSFIIFENYLTKDQLKEKGYQNIERAEMTNLPSNQLRHVRNAQSGDPVQMARSSEYPPPGKYSDGKADYVGEFYKEWEVFYKEDGKYKFCVTNGTTLFFRDPIDNPYGDIFPVVMGVCLTEPHKMIGEGFPESLEGPQDSINYNLNIRKDSVALNLAPPTIVSRYGGVDLQSLLNRKPGAVTLADDVNAVSQPQIRDVTQSSYNEAALDDAMMQEMSGVTPGKQGMGQEEKATVANINYAESNAKIDLYIAIVGETFVRDFFYKLAKLIVRFETDERVFRVANDSWRKKTGVSITPDIIPDFDIDLDCEVNVGAGTIGRQMDIQQTLMAMDRMITANQSQLAMAQAFAGQDVPVEFYNVVKIADVLLPKMGIKNFDDFKLQLKAPPPPPGKEGGNGVAGILGRISPQIGNGPIAPENDMQRGGMGGI